MEATNGGADALKSLPRRLKGVLQEIHGEQCSHVPNPSGCKKRASVALVIRIRPSFAQLATYDQEKCSSSINEFQESLDNFYSQDWVRHGDPEVLFIKRAARVGDRWTSHIALPGGKRDPEDSEDRATSIRETREETGLELDIDHCLYIGNLPERIIRTAWDQTP
jgi:8-oxo-dGTP pyrophosphatase MutT (NUDIX family)